MERREKLLFYDGYDCPTSVNLVRTSPGKNFLLDECELVSIQILKRKLISNRQKFSVDEKHVLLVFVPDVEVVT
jgi:hypothetical protein